MHKFCLSFSRFTGALGLIAVVSGMAVGCKSTQSSAGSPSLEGSSHWIQSGGANNPHDFKYYASKNYEGVLFYNLENLFDTIDGPNDDAEFLPSGDYQWGSTRYNQKLNNMATVLDSIQNRMGYGLGSALNRPHLTLMGFVELENQSVLDDLFRTWKSMDEAGNKNAVQTGVGVYRTEKKATFDYTVVHRESPDKRGIDVALAYDSLAWSLIRVDMISVPIPGNFPTRDIMAAHLIHRGTQDTFLVAVNHWPSRRGGSESVENRAIAARSLRAYCNRPFVPRRIIIMGDFNDDPSDVSLTKELGASGHLDEVAARALKLSNGEMLFNLSKTYRDSGWIQGSLAYRPFVKGSKELQPVQWNQFDQIIISRTLLGASMERHAFVPTMFNSAKKKSPEVKKLSTQLVSTPVAFGVYSPNWMRQHEDPYMDFPLRTFGGKKFLKGYSDHFPVYLLLNF